MILDVPGPPRNLGKTEVTESSVSLSWEQPEDDGGRPVTNYVIERRETTRSGWNNSMSSKTTGTSDNQKLAFVFVVSVILPMECVYL